MNMGWLGAMICMAIFILPLPAAASKIMHIGTLLELPPEHPATLRARQAYLNLGMEMQLELLPIERLRLEAQRGQLIDGNLAGAWELGEAVPELIRIPVPIYQLELAAYVSDAQLHIRHWRDLRPLRVIYLKGMFSVLERLKSNQVTQLQTVMSMQQALQYVARGRADVAVLPRAEAEFVLQQMAGLKVQAVLPVLEQLPLYHYIHQKHQALVGPLTAQFENLKAPAPAGSAQ